MKEEPSRHFLSEVSGHCRCCFQPLLNDEQYPADEKTLAVFQECVQTFLTPSPMLSAFCNRCFHDINNFHQFKQLATLKQNKFNEMSSNNDFNDFLLIHKMTLEDSLNEIIKNEEEDHKVIKFKIIPDNFENYYESNTTSVAEFEEPKLEESESGPKLDEPDAWPDAVSEAESEKSELKSQLKIKNKRHGNIGRKRVASVRTPACPHCTVVPHNLNKHILRCHTIKCCLCPLKDKLQKKLRNTLRTNIKNFQE